MRDLTLNLGVRYEYDSNPENDLAYPAINVATALTDPFNAVIKVNEDRNNIAPRLGFAYAPQVAADVSLATGRRLCAAVSESFLIRSSPTLRILTTGRGVANASTAITSLPTTPNLLNTVTSVDKNQVNPLTYQYNLGVEQELPSNSKMSIFYVGTRGEKLFAQGAFNYFGPSGTRLNPIRGAIAARGNYVDSNYNSVQVDVDHNFQHGIFVRGAYTYGKALNDATDVFAQFDTNTVYPANLAPGGIHG